MKILCSECTHGDVCKHKATYLKTIDDLKVNVYAPFTLELECPFYTFRTVYSNSNLNGYLSTTITADKVPSITFSNDAPEEYYANALNKENCE